MPEKGNFCLFLAGTKSHVWAESLDDLVALTEDHIDEQGVYFGTAAYKTSANRKQTNVESLKSFRLDIDAGAKKHASNPAGTYQSKEDAEAALENFLEHTGLKPSLVVSSGEGLHVYFELDDPVAPTEWTPIAAQFQTYCEAHGLRVDTAVTEDTARVLRPPGTPHSNGNRVSVIKETGAVYTLGEFARIVGHSPAQASDARWLVERAFTAAQLAINDELSLEFTGPPSSALKVVQHCGALREVAETGGDVQEPLWRAMLGLVKHTTEGTDIAHEWSSGYAGYDEAEVDRKFDAWTTGPTTCSEFSKHSTACANCVHKGKIKSPIVLGMPDAAPPADLSTPQALRAAIEQAGLTPIMDTDGELHLVEISSFDGRRVRSVLNARSEAAADAITARVGATGKGISKAKRDEWLARMRYEARQCREPVRLYLRAADVDGVIYVDHGSGRVVRISAEGVELLDDLDNGVPLFIRGAGAGHLPDHLPCEDPRQALKILVAGFVGQLGVSAETALLIVAALLEWHRTEAPHPILEFVGPAGSAKSSASDYIVSLIDPTGNGKRVTVGTDGDDIAAAAQQRYVLPVDNAGKLDRDTSNLLCVISTGGSLMVRRLYTNGETASLSLHRPLVVTAVAPVCTAPDLQARVIRCELAARVGGYLSEEVLRARRDADRPRMLGAKYCLLSATLRELPAVRERREWGHRQVDFDQMGCAIAQAAGLDPAVFMKAVARMRTSMARRTASGDLFLIALLETLRKLANHPTCTAQQSLNAVIQQKPAPVGPGIWGNPYRGYRPAGRVACAHAASCRLRARQRNAGYGAGVDRRAAQNSAPSGRHRCSNPGADPRKQVADPV
ncbi:MAG: hypothetical protein IPI16_05410 [Comamonadaceae bacterium]|nr:hypothetical protein [Comamonadaceae bacterium]